MHAGLTALLESGSPLGEWSWEPGVVLPMLAAGALYVRGAAVLWSHEAHRGIQPWKIASFAAGWLVVALALLSPLHAASEQSFSAHMIQHEALMVVAAPLLVLARPVVVLLWAFPAKARRAVGRVLSAPRVRRGWRALVRPFDAWLIHGLIIWVWHIPPLFEAALSNDAVHAAQHLSFLGSALLFWWVVIFPERRAALGMSVVYLFTTAVHTGGLGALMAFARAPWYPLYSGRAGLWGLTAIGDQQLAGLIMWIPASTAYLVAALFIVRRWLRDSEWRVAEHERAGAAV
jgi:putative membrane protein